MLFRSQASLPSEDRMTYEEYLASQGDTSGLDKAAAKVSASAVSTIKALQDLGVGGGGDVRNVLAKLTSGQALTDAEKQLLNITPATATTDSVTPTPESKPSVLKAGFTAGPLPAEYQKLLGNPSILGWRIVTDSNGTQFIEVQTDATTTQTFGAWVGGNPPKQIGRAHV